MEIGYAEGYEIIVPIFYYQPKIVAYLLLASGHYMNTYIDFPNTPPYGYGFIYFLRSPSGKGYIGQTIRALNKRIRCHVSRDKGGCCALHAAIKKYGIETFFVDIVGQYPITELDNAEINAVVEFGTLAPNGYNLRTGGQKTHTCSSETRQKMSRSARMRVHTHTYTHSAETRAKLAAAARNRPPPSVETRQKLSRLRKGIPQTQEVIQKRIAGMKAARASRVSTASLLVCTI
jgi:group I intron endonuclease